MNNKSYNDDILIMIGVRFCSVRLNVEQFWSE